MSEWSVRSSAPMPSYRLQIGVRSRSTPANAISFAGFPTLSTVHVMSGIKLTQVSATTLSAVLPASARISAEPIERAFHGEGVSCVGRLSLSGWFR